MIKFRTEEFYKAIEEYRKGIDKADEFNMFITDIVLEKDDYKVTDMVMKYLDNFPEHMGDSILAKITKKINEIYHELEIEVNVEPIEINYREWINTLKECIKQGLDEATDKLLEDDISYEEYCESIRFYINETLDGILSNFKELKESIDETNENINKEKRKKNFKVIK